MSVSIGIDIGGTKIAGGLVDAEGRLVEQARRDTPAQDAEAIITGTVDLIRELAEKARAYGDETPKVGVACAGYIDREGATVLFAPNIAWRHEPLRAQLQEATGHDVVIENDANAAGYGEFRYGGGKNVDDMVMITLGTGVGGGIVLGGEVFRGSHGVGAEIGHILVLEPARVAFAEELTGGGHRPAARFCVATLGNDAGVIGAAALAREGRA